MDTIVLYNQNGQKFDVDVVRYFKKADKKYLIFSLDEKDNNGYVQLYLTKVEDLDGQFVMGNVTDEKEWADFRNAIQLIVNNNKASVPNNDLLDCKPLNGSTVSEFRIFKLKEDVAEVLSKKDPEVKPEREMDLQSASAADTGMSIEEILKQVSEGAKSAREVTKVDLNKKKLTIEDLLNKQEPVTEEVPAKDEVIELDDDETLKAPVVSVEEPKVEEDYKAKYEEVLAKLKNLEKENVRLINELVEATAKLETIKDIIE